MNNRGEVVGLVSARSVAQLGAGGGRVPIGFSYAQGVDLMRELLNGTAESMQRVRDDRWRGRLSEVSLTTREMPDQLIAELTHGDDPEQIGEVSVALNATGFRNAATVQVRLEPGYRHIIVAVAEDWSDIDLFVAAEQRLLGKDEELDWYPVVVLNSVDAVTEALIHIVASPPLRSEECNVTLRVVRVNDSK